MSLFDTDYSFTMESMSTKEKIQNTEPYQNTALE